MKLISGLGRFFSFIFNVRVIRKAILCTDQEKKQKHKAYAIGSIIVGILGVLLIVPACYGGVKLIQFAFTHMLAIIGNIFLILFGVVFCFLPLVLCESSITYAIAELIMNRKALSWISLVLSIIFTIGAILLAVFLFMGNLNGLGVSLG